MQLTNILGSMPDILWVAADGEPISTPRHATDLIGDAWGAEASTVAVPIQRLDPAFFDLSSGVAGEIAQKLVNYRIRLAVIGDVAPFAEASSALRDWVWESNRGDQVWFLPDAAALEARLRPGPEGGPRVP